MVITRIWKKKAFTILRLLSIILFFIFLTLLTQIGGMVLLISLWLGNKWSKKFYGKHLLLFVAIYSIATLVIVPVIAPVFGREVIHSNDLLKPSGFVGKYLNRNYVSPKLNQVLGELSANHSLIYLDASFPFIDGFPLLPHLSHNDGNKIDLSFIYETPEGKPTHQNKSVSGYGIFENPKPGEHNQITICKNLGYFQYDYSKYLTFGKRNEQLIFSASKNRQLISDIISIELVGKVFIEAHLVSRLGLQHNKIRYHGCQAVRHDDHIHLQITPELQRKK